MDKEEIHRLKKWANIKKSALVYQSGSSEDEITYWAGYIQALSDILSLMEDI